MQKGNLGDVTLDDVDDVSSIKIDRRKTSNKKILEFITKVKNPYIFKVNGKLVRISFTDTDRTAEDCFTNVLKNLYFQLDQLREEKMLFLGELRPVKF